MDALTNLGLLPEVPDYHLFSGRQYAGDETLLVIFYMGVLPNDGKTVEMGRPIFDDVESVKVIVPGDRNNQIDRPATPQDKQRWAKQYAAFKAGKTEDEQLSGTRLHDWPFLTRGQVEEFRYLGLRTVEQLADVRDDVCIKVPGLTQLKQNARIWLDKAKGTAESAKAARLIAEQQNQIDTMKKVIDAQGERIEKLMTKVASTA